MKKEVNPKETTRAQAFELWMKAPNPMVTFFKTLDVTRLVRVSSRRGLKFNMLMDWCIGKAAADIKEFYLLSVGDKLVQYDALAVNTIVKNRNGEVTKKCGKQENQQLHHRSPADAYTRVKGKAEKKSRELFGQKRAGSRPPCASLFSKGGKGIIPGRWECPRSCGRMPMTSAERGNRISASSGDGR